MVQYALQVKDLTKVFQEKKKTFKAVDTISFRVTPKQVFGLLGPNGAGKTTTVKMICGLILPDKGKISVMGVDMIGERSKALKYLSAVLEGNRNVYWRLTPRENLEFFAATRKRRPSLLKEEIYELLHFFQLHHKENTPSKNLSRGMQQKLALAVCLISNTPLILLDEPTLGLDVKASHEIRVLLRKLVTERGLTVILTTHDMNVVEEVCDEVLIMNKGHIIVQDQKDNLLSLFRARSYQLVVQGDLSYTQEGELRKLPFVHLVKGDGQVSMRINLKRACQIYEVFEILKKGGSIIESIEQSQVNFEKVFMELLGGG